jgi:hypothetical protein
MRSLILAALVGAILGVGLSRYWYQIQLPHQVHEAVQAAVSKHAQTQAELQTQLKRQEQALQQLQASTETLQKENTMLRSQTAPVTTNTPPVNISGPSANVRRQFMEQRLAVYKLRLNLTPAQASRLDAWMAQKKGTERLSGEELEEAVTEILTPVQKAEYDKLQEEQKRSQWEMAATMMLNRYAAPLGLSEQQRDQVYSAFYNWLQQSNVTTTGWGGGRRRNFMDSPTTFELMAPFLSQPQQTMLQSMLGLATPK